MPLRSRAQAAYLKAHNPKVFKEFVAATPKGTHLPLHVKAKAKGKAKRHAAR